jgi:hypothetical protein
MGKNGAGNLVAAHRLVPAELNPIGSDGGTGATGATRCSRVTGAGLAAFGYVYIFDEGGQVVIGGTDVIFTIMFASKRNPH